ncbi:MAG: ABC transporter permease [Actinomycetota bacterium]|nr:ABC transporter permease [Actinomycetota bacterium]
MTARPAVLARPVEAWDRGVDRLVWLGALALFVGKVLASVPVVLTRRRGEVTALVNEITFGQGLLAIASSTVLVVFLLSAFVGIQIGLEGYQGLQIVGLTALSGLISAYGDTREIVPLITAFGLAAQIGCKFTAELGAMRISEEVDALEVMAVPGLPYLVTTRVLAAMVAVIPLYLLALAGSYIATQFSVALIAHQGTGTYLHYFHAYLNLGDLVDSLLKVVIFAIAIVIVHTYYGFTTSGGPENVGLATGRAIRTSIVMLAVLDLLLTMLFYGLSPNAIRFTG